MAWVHAPGPYFRFIQWYEHRMASVNGLGSRPRTIFSMYTVVYASYVKRKWIHVSGFFNSCSGTSVVCQSQMVWVHAPGPYFQFIQWYKRRMPIVNGPGSRPRTMFSIYASVQASYAKRERSRCALGEHQILSACQA